MFWKPFELWSLNLGLLATVAGVTCGTGTADVTRRFGAGREGGERARGLSFFLLTPSLSTSLYLSLSLSLQAQAVLQLSFSRGMASNSVVHV